MTGLSVYLLITQVEMGAGLALLTLTFAVCDVTSRQGFHYELITPLIVGKYICSKLPRYIMCCVILTH